MSGYSRNLLAGATAARSTLLLTLTFLPPPPSKKMPPARLYAAGDIIMGLGQAAGNRHAGTVYTHTHRHTHTHTHTHTDRRAITWNFSGASYIDCKQTLRAGKKSFPAQTLRHMSLIDRHGNRVKTRQIVSCVRTCLQA